MGSHLEKTLSMKLFITTESPQRDGSLDCNKGF